jgi:RING finger and CHY zinc finger domain-containing protein 1
MSEIIEEIENQESKCSHYENGCELFAKCCGKFYPCRHCHNENNDFGKEAHELNPEDIDLLKCIKCSNEQKISNKCTKCDSKFGEYFCEICKIFLNKDVSVFHCDECKLCRIGNKEEYFHCKKCDCCKHISFKDNHICSENQLDQSCPVCLEYLKNSKEIITILTCKHIIHVKCLGKMIESGQKKCPICNCSVIDETEEIQRMDELIASTPMPHVYKDQISNILCNQCQTKSQCKFHIIGHKCSACGSYNTSKI